MKYLEIKHLAPYLIHKIETNKGTLTLLEGHHCECKRAMLATRYTCEAIKPILKPLSDLKNDMVTILKEEYNQDYYFNKFKEDTQELVLNDKQGSAAYWTLTPESIENNWHWNFVNVLLKRHYDIFGLIDKELAIDKNLVHQIIPPLS